MSSDISGLTFLNQYYIEEFITLTALGELYRATDTRSNIALALILLPKSISENAETLKSLEAEAVKLGGISHPNIAQYHGLYQTPKNAFLLEEWIDGPSLRAVLEKTPLSVNEVLVYAKAICSGLEALHKQNYLFLNFAPELIRINKKGEIFMGGIGAARQIGTNTAGTHGKYPQLYFSPEQFSGLPLTPASDIYSLAVLLYQLSTGRWINGRHAPKSNEAIRKAHLDLNPPAPNLLNLEIPDHFSRMLLWALRKNPADRLKTTTELLSSLTFAVRLTVDEVPPRASSPKSAAVTSALLGGWKYLPTPEPNILTQDLPPLEDRLPAIIQSKKQKPRIGLVPIFAITLLAGFISLFLLVRPAPIVIPTPIQFTPFASDYTPPPTFTPLPKPTVPNGGRIAFTCTRGDHNQLCMINRDGTGLSQLSDMEASSYYPAFTPNEDSLLFSSNRNGSFDLYLLIFNEKQLFQLTENIGNVVSPDYSADGRRIVFANKVGNENTSIWMVNADGANPHLVYAGAGTIVAVAWSADGEQIAYAMSVGIPQEYEIYTMDTNGKNHLRVSQGLQGIGGSIDWSPDGRNLLIYAGPYEDKDIFTIELASGKTTQLTDGGNNAGGSYSPDGRYIVFNSQRNQDQADLYIMRFNGDNQTQLTNDPEPDWGAVWVQ